VADLIRLLGGGQYLLGPKMIKLFNLQRKKHVIGRYEGKNVK